mgnify:CR=1 FL=1
MKLLLVDIGNTTADFRLYDAKDGTLTPLIRPLSQDSVLSDRVAIKDKLDQFQISFDAVIYVSVVPDLNNLIRAIADLYQIPVYSLRHDLPVDWSRFSLKNIHLLGADFVANFYGVEAAYQYQNCAVVALGTATTIFVINEGQFVGTTISPGIQSSLQGLFAQAALLSEMDYALQEGTLGFNTFESISIGTINGHYHMIMGLIAEIKKEYPIEHLIFTGGNLHYYEDAAFREEIIFDETLIFKGLIYLYQQLQKEEERESHNLNLPLEASNSSKQAI